MSKPSNLPSDRVAVTTESGAVYRIDFIAWRITRAPGAIPSEDSAVAPSAHLRRDGQSLRLLDVFGLEVGSPAVFVLQPLGAFNTVATTRTTTYVTSIAADNDPEMLAETVGESDE